MLIKTKQTTEHEVEINIPFFRKQVEHGMTSYFAMLTEGYVNKAHSTDESQSVAVSPKWINEDDIVKAYKMLGNWVEISENEFLRGYKEIISSLSLEPTLVRNQDDLKNINI